MAKLQHLQNGGIFLEKEKERKRLGFASCWDSNHGLRGVDQVHNQWAMEMCVVTLQNWQLIKQVEFAT